MIALLLALLLAQEEVTFVDATIEPEGEILGYRIVDVDADGREEISLVVRTTTGTRELRLFRIADRGAEVEPFHVVPVLDDAIAYGFADVREEPGRELLFLARGGIWSMSITRDGYRDNLLQLVAMDLIYDVADPDELPYWAFVTADEAGDRILLPGELGYAIWGRGTDEPGYVRTADFPRELSVGRPDSARRTVSIGRGGLSVDAQVGDALPTPFIVDERITSRRFLSSEREYRAPALLDVDGDGRLDLLLKVGAALHLHFGHAGGFGAEPDRVETWPDYLSVAADLELVDLDGDGDLDLLGRSEKEEGVARTRLDLFLLVNDGKRLFPEEPSQRMRFEAAELRVDVADVDGDGRPDLAVRQFEAPSLLDAVTEIEFTLTWLLYPGQSGGRPFERKPALKETQTFDEASLEEAIKNRLWELDCDGDGLADVVEVDLEGRIAIRRFERSKSMFGGTSLHIETAPWRLFSTAGNIDELEVLDLNGDGLADVVSLGDEALTILLSTRTGAHR